LSHFPSELIVSRLTKLFDVYLDESHDRLHVVADDGIENGRLLLVLLQNHGYSVLDVDAVLILLDL